MCSSGPLNTPCTHKKAVQISQSRYTHVAHNYYTNTQYLLPCLTAGAAHLPGDQILCGGNRIHILAGSSTQKTGGPRSCRGPTAAVLYFWTTAPHYTLTLFYNTPQKCLPKSVEFNIYCSTLCILYLWKRLRNLFVFIVRYHMNQSDIANSFGHIKCFYEDPKKKAPHPL